MKATKTVFALTCALFAPYAWAEDVIRESAPSQTPPPPAGSNDITGPISGGGTITQLGDGSMMLRTEASPTPIQYHYSDTTQWVDQTGKVVTRESIRPGLPVNISYTKSAAGLVISKVVVLPPSAPAAVEGSTSSTTTTTTTTAPVPVAVASDPAQLGGTIAEMGEDTVTLRTEAATSPVKFRYSSTTQWMDGAGHTVTPDFVRPGTHALVYYTNGTSGLVISKIVVRREPAPAVVPTPPPTDPAPEVTAPQKKEVEERHAPKATSR